MKENVKKFYDLLATDEALQAEMQAINAGYEGRELTGEARQQAVAREILPLAVKAGLPFTMEELTAYDSELAANERTAVSDDELEAIAGGKNCSCIAGGGGKRSKSGNTKDKMCACVGGGGGTGIDENGNKVTRCVCILGGVGNDLSEVYARKGGNH